MTLIVTGGVVETSSDTVGFSNTLWKLSFEHFMVHTSGGGGVGCSGSMFRSLLDWGLNPGPGTKSF